MRRIICLIILSCFCCNLFAEQVQSADPSASLPGQGDLVGSSPDLFSVSPSDSLFLTDPTMNSVLQRYLKNSEIQRELQDFQIQSLKMQLSEKEIFNQQLMTISERDLKELQKMNKFYGIISITAIITSSLVAGMAIYVANK